MASFGATKYGMVFTDPAPDRPAEAASNGAVAPASPSGFVGSPMFWLLGIAAATFGLVGVSTSARIGPVSGSISAGVS